MSENPPDRDPARPEDPAAAPAEGAAEPGTSTSGSAAGGPAAQEASTSGETSHAPLFPKDEREAFEARWSDIQADFVGQPLESVSQADRLADEIIDRLSALFIDERSHLEHQWNEGEQPSTEDLRLTLRRYRSLIERLLSS